MKFKIYADKVYSKLDLETTSQNKIICYRKRRVYPILNPDGSIHWFNFLTGGSWIKLLSTLLIIAIILGAIIEYHNNLKQCSKFMEEYNLKILVDKNNFSSVEQYIKNYQQNNISLKKDES